MSNEPNICEALETAHKTCLRKVKRARNKEAKLKECQSYFDMLKDNSCPWKPETSKQDAEK